MWKWLCSFEHHCHEHHSLLNTVDLPMQLQLKWELDWRNFNKSPSFIALSIDVTTGKQHLTYSKIICFLLFMQSSCSKSFMKFLIFGLITLILIGLILLVSAALDDVQWHNCLKYLFWLKVVLNAELKLFLIFYHSASNVV